MVTAELWGVKPLPVRFVRIELGRMAEADTVDTSTP
jgi:hypothetical protein